MLEAVRRAGPEHLAFNVPETDDARLDDNINPETFEEYITTLPDWEREILEEAMEQTSEVALYEALANSDTMAVTDDGAIPELNMRSFGWVIATPRKVLWECKGPVRGIPSQSFCSEGYGRLSLFLFLRRYAEFFRFQQQWTIRTGLDNTSIMQRENKYRQRKMDLPCYSKAPDANVIIQTAEETGRSPNLTYTMEHVPGHQDKKIPFSKLPHMAQLNVLADQLVTAALNQQLQRSKMGAKTFHPVQSCPVYLQQVDGYTIMSREYLYMKNCIPESDMDTYRKNKFKWTNKVLQLIDWTAYRQAPQQLADFMIKFATKLEIGWLPTNSRLHLQKERSNDQCVLC
jgi:hypothetical protein